jgi:hypothetical protein
MINDLESDRIGVHDVENELKQRFFRGEGIKFSPMIPLHGKSPDHEGSASAIFKAMHVVVDKLLDAVLQKVETAEKRIQLEYTAMTREGFSTVLNELRFCVDEHQAKDVESERSQAEAEANS